MNKLNRTQTHIFLDLALSLSLFLCLSLSCLLVVCINCKQYHYCCAHTMIKMIVERESKKAQIIKDPVKN